MGAEAECIQNANLYSDWEFLKKHFRYELPITTGRKAARVFSKTTLNFMKADTLDRLDSWLPMAR